jgi:hypothetical protein
MVDFDVQTVELAAPFDVAFRYLSDPGTLPEWTHAFRSVSGGRAVLATPRGSVEVGLVVKASREAGTVDWMMTFPDGARAAAFSRLLDRGPRSLYSFVLLAPPVPLAEVEGALEEQSRTLREELRALQRRLSGATGSGG